MSTKNKILMISYFFPPYKAIGAIRNHAISKQFSKYGDVIVLSTKNAFLTKPQSLDTSDCTPKYLSTFDFKTIQLSKGKKQVNKNSTLNYKQKRRISKYLLIFPFNILFGEGGLIYIISAFYTALKHSKETSIIYSSYSPFSDHFIAFLVKIIRKNIVWIADFRDLHQNPDLKNTFRYRYGRRVNRFIFSRADILTTVSEGLALHLKYYNSNVHVLRNGITPELLQDKVSSKFKEKNHFSISYTGALYFGQRDPTLLFKAISELINEEKIDKNKLIIRYAGKEGSLWMEKAKENNIESIARDYGMLPLDDALALQANSQVNILLSWASENQKGILTGKFYEYLRMGNPILLIIKGCKDEEFENVFSSLKAGKLVYGNEEYLEQAKQFIYQNYSHWLEHGRSKQTINKKELEKYYWSNSFPKFYNEVINNR